MKIIRTIIRIDKEKCDGCGLCVPACAEGAMAIVDGKAKVIRDPLCDGLGACIGQCPQGALTLIEREAEPFDEEEVHRHLESMKKDVPPTGCPSAAMHIMEPKTHKTEEAGTSALTHWPVQIRLVSPEAPFLKGADLLILADCAAVADPNLHRDLLPGKVVLMGCPKFDDAGYEAKFQAIFTHSKIRSITIASMEVPCCGGLPAMARKAHAASHSSIPITEVVISRDGTRGGEAMNPGGPRLM